jgi:hypothetical protein
MAPPSQPYAVDPGLVLQKYAEAGGAGFPKE